MYNKELIKELLKAYPTLNNVDIAKLYNEAESTEFTTEALRKVISKQRIKLNIPNPGLSSKLSTTPKPSFSFQPKYDIIPDESIKKIDMDKGTFTSTVDTMFDPKDDIELALLHKIDLTKYKISTYWSKLKSNGKFTSSVNCTLKRLGDSVTIEDIKEALTDAISGPGIITKARLKPVWSDNDKALVIWVSDEHIGASVTKELYTNDWNEDEYLKRKSRIIDVVQEQAELHGNFEKIIFATLGDTMDGHSGQTTRGGHNLPQNMTNKEAIKTYVEVNKYVYDEITKLHITNQYELYNVENSNHGGMGWDAAANFALETYLKATYGDKFDVVNFEKIIDTFTFGVNQFHLTHGKDELHMKRNLPLFLNDKVENFIKEYMDENGYSQKAYNQHFVKGDLHQFATQQGKFSTYTNIPSLFGSSGWSMANFGKGKAGFCYSVVPKESNSFSFTPVWIK